MGAAYNSYTYEIQEDSGSLVITWHGPRQIGFFIFYISFFNLLLLFVVYNFYSDIAITPGSSKELFVCGGFFLVMILVYFFFTSAIPLDLLLPEEIITVTEHSIEIRKSGFGSFVRRKEFSITGNTVFYLMTQFFGPKYLIFYNPASDRLIKSIPLPMFKDDVQHHAFCTGISYEDSTVVLERIKTKFPRVRIQ
jgi:hypothetical protein